MARFKEDSTSQGKFIAIHLDEQIVPGTFEHTLSYLIDHELDLTAFEDRYKNDDTGAPAYNPALLLKVILFAYSRGIVSSRDIAEACRTVVTFMALSGDSRPHFTTIAHFISSMNDQIAGLFLEVLGFCHQEGLIGKEMFAIDGCKLPSNASKAWSGTRADYKRRIKKLDRAIRFMLNKHREEDASESSRCESRCNEQHVKRLSLKAEKYRQWLKKHPDKMGSRGKVKQSNITDNESAKMTTSHGTIQGYNGVAMVDSKHQVVVHAEAFGEGDEHGLLQPMVEQTRETFQTLGTDEDIFKKAKLTADSGFHSEKNVKMLAQEGIDAYVADKGFRKRDPRFLDAGRYKERHRKERAKYEGRSGLFRPQDFTFDPDLKFCICPAGKRLYRHGANVPVGRSVAVKFRGPESACVPCHLRSRCLQNPDRTKTRNVHVIQGRSPTSPERFMDKMKRKIDSVKGRLIYELRLGTVEPVFGNLRHCKKLDRFTLRGKCKVNTQWLLFCMVHNLGKIHRYGSGFA